MSSLDGSISDKLTAFATRLCSFTVRDTLCVPTMHQLSPLSLSRLRILAEKGPRFYRMNSRIRLLEAKGLTVATGRIDTSTRAVEHRITDAGQAVLAERYGVR